MREEGGKESLRNVSPKRRLTFNGLHAVISRNVELFSKK
jgi:hypothetical protein